ncbi:MAG TPA: SDR family NAD(P)-dependent oxidoreductase [Dinghuibacter sp.]|uniref:SDR family NAD(P)-dependent oxidoreductase n=1 Tax=Dinghuibacter sp. TaxID=2024697 RepID=UPI002BE65319|nr:SDR family NAD(P)-dependent oxidoreductase [Dinghuibacter sp.]HTJ13836.1 SDR family NAD(P)-dependent oxidoreductase [Dinghuibacter sp.]
MTKIVLVTGATSGIGAACARKFSAEGYNVIATGRRADRLDELKASLKTDMLPLVFDVQDKAAVFQTLQNLPKAWQPIDVLVNNAGLALGRDYFDEASLDDWETMIDTNVKGLLYVSRAILPLMTARGRGHIINLGSTAGKEVYEKGNVYCATKFSVAAISQAMRIDLLRHGIKVTAIHPGAVETEFSVVRFKGDKTTADSVYAGIEPLVAEDVADTIYYTTTLPDHVCINDLVMTCTQQANSMYMYRK